MAVVAALTAAPRVQALPTTDWKTRSAARQLGVEGLALMKKEQWSEAYDKLDRAYKLYPAPTLGLAVARCLVELQRLVEAAELYREVASADLTPSDGYQQRNAVQKAEQERLELLPKIPSLEVIVKGARGDGITVLVDQEVLPPELVDTAHPVDPGDHEVRVRRGDVTITETATVAEGETARVVLQLPELPKPPPPPEEGPDWTTWMWVAFGVGGGGLVVAAINGPIALSQRSTLRDRCPDGICPPDAHDVVDAYDATRVATTIGFVVAGLGAAAGTAFFFLDDGDDTSTELGVGPGAIDLRVRF